MTENNIEELLHIYDQPIYIDTDFDLKSKIPKGGFEQKVMVALQEHDLNSETEVMLLKMLAACGFSEKDYMILKINNEQVMQAINQFQPETVLLFDLHLNTIAFNALKEKYAPFRFAGKKFLLCDSLNKISTNPTLKSALWTQGLKRLFNIA